MASPGGSSRALFSCCKQRAAWISEEFGKALEPAPWQLTNL
jgi:hypothetical protein